jgi:hypothetical protein
VKAALARLEPMVERLTRLEPMVERLVTLFETVLPHLATKAEVSDLRTEMHDQYAALRTEMQSGSDDQRTETKERFTSLQIEMNERFREVRLEIARTETNLYNEISNGDNRLRNDISGLRTELRVGPMEKPSKTYLCSVIGALITAYLTGLAGIAALRRAATPFHPTRYAATAFSSNTRPRPGLVGNTS